LSRVIKLAQPSIVLALITMALLVLVLALRATGRLTRRGVALGAVTAMIIAALGAISQQVVTHG
jgi:ABC-type hemin transport system substrate-binding protein